MARTVLLTKFCHSPSSFVLLRLNRTAIIHFLCHSTISKKVASPNRDSPSKKKQTSARHVNSEVSTRICKIPSSNPSCEETIMNCGRSIHECSLSFQTGIHFIIGHDLSLVHPSVHVITLSRLGHI